MHLRTNSNLFLKLKKNLKNNDTERQILIFN